MRSFRDTKCSKATIFGGGVEVFGIFICCWIKTYVVYFSNYGDSVMVNVVYVRVSTGGSATATGLRYFVSVFGSL